MKKAAPYGTWNSPISAGDVSATDSHPNWPGFVGDEIWWSERLPHEGGRTTLMRRTADAAEARSVLPAPWNVRSRVMEYGGRAWAGKQTADGPLVVFVRAEDQRLYRFEPEAAGAVPQPLTPVSGAALGQCFADPVLAPRTVAARSAGEVWCVRETTGPDGVPRRDLVAVPLDGSAAEDAAAIRPLAGGHDFLTGPQVSPDGRHVAWIGWDHPDMPWDASRVQVAAVGPDGTLAVLDGVAPRPTDRAGRADMAADTADTARTLDTPESVAQVVWTDDGALYAVTDRPGWWNVHRVPLDGGEPVNVCPRQEEFGGALTKLGLTWCASLEGGRLAVLHGTHALTLSILDPATGELCALPCPFTEWEPLLASDGRRLVAIGASAVADFTTVCFDTRAGTYATLSVPRATADPELLPRPEARSFEGPDGHEVHAVVFPPRHPDVEGPAGELPPYVVFAHSGPTSRFPMAYDLQVAYFTSRGIGVVGVNYGGSTGYGRQYRERLRHAWGVTDVADCAAVARGLAAEGSADPARLAIRGASAGGWTAAVSLTATDTYCCAALYYPVLDPVSWRESQNGGFEAFYLDTLIGPWPQARERYLVRSPAHSADRVEAPFLLLQGSADPICPPSQAERFLAGVRPGAAPHRHVVFEGERHGFKRGTTIIECIEAELTMYKQAFGVAAGRAPGPAEPEPGLSAPELVHELVRSQALRAPGRVAVRDADGPCTYAELLARAEELGERLRAAGVRAGDRVGIHLDRSRDLVAGMLAVLLSGGSYLPLDPEYPADRLSFMIDDARPAALLTRLGLNVPPHGTDQRLVYVDGEPSGSGAAPAAEAPAARRPAAVTPDDAAFVIYTSGSTGTPKGAVLPHRGIANILRHSLAEFGFGADDAVLALAPVSFDFAQLEILLPLVAGGAVHLVDRAVARDPELLDAALTAGGATFVMGTPSMLAALTASGWRPGSRLSIVSGGEALTGSLAAALAGAGALWNIYGPTETSVYSLCERVGADAAGDITLGRPVGNTVVEILRDGERCADGETGEIHIGGHGLAAGYLGRPDLTEQRFIADPFRPGGRLYRTGDLARRRPDGRIAYEGRNDDQVKVRGHRVELGEVEERLRGHDGVRAAAVVAERAHHSLRLVAYVVLAEGTDTAGLRAHLARSLPAYALPSRFVALDEIPLSPNGKTDRRALRELGGPAAAMSPELAGIWRDVLGTATVEDTDNFFDIGGDSLSAMEVVVRARQAGIPIRPADLYSTATLGELLALAAERRAAAPAGPAPAADLPPALSPAQHRFLDWGYRESDHYNVSVLLDVDGTVDRATLGTALRLLADRHPALRLRLTGPAEAPEAVTDPAPPVPLSWHELPPGTEAEEDEAFLAEADRLQRSLSLREGPVWRVAVFAGRRGHRLLLVFHHLVTDGMSRKILTRDLGTLYEQVAAGRTAGLPAAVSWAAHAGTLRRFANGPLDRHFLRRWEALPWDALRPLPADRATGSMHLRHIRSFATTVAPAAGAGPAEQEELLVLALVMAVTAETGARAAAVDVCRHGRTDPTGGPGFPDTVGWLNSIAPYVLALPEPSGRSGQTGPEADADATVAAALRRQIGEIRDMEQTWGALRHLHDDPAVRHRLCALPEPDVYLNFLGHRMNDLGPSGPFRARAGAVGTEMTTDRTQPYAVKLYAQYVPAGMELCWQFSSDVHDEDRIRRVARATEQWMERLSP
ncbi:amino acid adenylation domain-containing protein [Streptomyces sp. NPDC058734]|uniref:S9 family peptidase n=1 Tax=Streptomyces sp. NPDC058734 TaxID=3346615 RepID=UPI0036BDC441